MKLNKLINKPSQVLQDCHDNVYYFPLLEQITFEHRDGKTEIGIQRLEHKDLNTEIGIQRLEHRDWKTEIGTQRLEHRDSNTEI